MWTVEWLFRRYVRQRPDLLLLYDMHSRITVVKKHDITIRPEQLRCCGPMQYLDDFIRHLFPPLPGVKVGVTFTQDHYIGMWRVVVGYCF